MVRRWSGVLSFICNPYLTIRLREIKPHERVDLPRNSHARSGPRFCSGVNSAKERDDQASEGIIIVTRSYALQLDCR